MGRAPFAHFHHGASVVLVGLYDAALYDAIRDWQRRQPMHVAFFSSPSSLRLLRLLRYFLIAFFAFLPEPASCTSPTRSGEAAMPRGMMPVGAQIARNRAPARRRADGRPQTRPVAAGTDAAAALVPPRRGAHRGAGAAGGSGSSLRALCSCCSAPAAGVCKPSNLVRRRVQCMPRARGTASVGWVGWTRTHPGPSRWHWLLGAMRDAAGLELTASLCWWLR